MTTQAWAQFEALPLVAILRGMSISQVISIVDAIRAGGLTTLEITMNSAGAAGQIRAAIQRSEGVLQIGAGTVTSLALLREALDAGAGFIVTPAVEPAVIAECRRRDVPIFPGALSATEIMTAAEYGATMVKIFPADRVGPSYIRRIKEQLPHVRLMPTGGVDPDNLEHFYRAGAEGFGLGSSLLDKSRVDQGDWAWITARCRAFRDAYHRCRDHQPS